METYNPFRLCTCTTLFCHFRLLVKSKCHQLDFLKRVCDLVIRLFDVLLCGSAGDTQDFIEVLTVCQLAAGVKRVAGGDMGTS